MARQALAVQARPTTLAALTKQIQAAVDPLDWTVQVVREGDSLVVDLTGAICPDPLLAMMTVEAELGHADKSGLEAVKLYGHCSVAVDSAVSSGWMSVIDLDGYFSSRAALSPQAFGLPGAEASRMACEAERDRYSASASTTYSEIVLETETTDLVLDSEPQAPELVTAPKKREHCLELEDPWEMELSADDAAMSPLSLEHFPRITQSRARPDAADALVVAAASPSSRQVSNQTAKTRKTAYSVQAEVEMRPSPRDTAAAGSPSKVKSATQTLASLTGYDLYRSFITDQSSWFAQTVKDDPRLHTLAKQRQHYTIGTLSHYLVDTLAENERLIDLMPVRKHDRGCGLIFTDQRVIALSQPSRRNSSTSLRNNHNGLQVWMVPWSWVHKVEICHDALRFHYDRAREKFSVDLEAPYHLRNAIPRDIPVRMVREIGSAKQRALDTKAGLAMVAGVMFALGSGFSLLNNMMNREQINARSHSLAASRSAIQADWPNQERLTAEQDLPGNNAPEESVAAPLMMTTNHEQCVNSFNNAAQPHAYATLNQVTQTLQVNLQNQVLLQMSQQQFAQTANSVAQEILSSCQAKAIGQVVVTNGVQRYELQRSASVIPVPAKEALKLF